MPTQDDNNNKNDTEQGSSMKTAGFLGIAGIMLSHIQTVVTELGMMGLVSLLLATISVCGLAYLARVNSNGSIISKWLSGKSKEAQNQK